MVADQRNFDFCPQFADYPLSDLIVECPQCTRLFAACCSHKGTLCHHFQLVFTDGACSNNGMDYARSGLGITMGGDEYSWSVFVDDTIDPGAPRTNQRAELLAAIEGLKKLHESNINKGPVYHKNLIRRHKEQERSIYIVVTDSEYVVKGITEWLPSWRERGWRTSDGKQPKNLDLFMKLDEYISSVEQVLVDVSFFHVPRAPIRWPSVQPVSDEDVNFACRDRICDT